MVLKTRTILTRIAMSLRPIQTRSFCSNKTPPTNNGNTNKELVDPSSSSSSSSLTRYDAYKELDNLNFMKAAKILFTEPPKKKKFGLDFHLVQLFFACLPSLAVYLVAQYARYEIRRMEAELEVKKKAEEEAKAKEMEEAAELEKEKALSDPQLLEVRERLDKLEETVKKIVVESEKESPDKQPAITGERSNGKSSQVGKHDAENSTNKKTSGERIAGTGQEKTNVSQPK